MTTTLRKFVLLCLSALMATLLQAQEDKAPSPAAPAAPLYQGADQPAPSGAAAVADTRPVAGAQALTLGSAGGGQNQLVPYFSITAVADSNPLFLFPSTGWGSVSSVNGGLQLQRSKEHQDLSLSYSGGGMFYGEQSYLDTTFQRLEVADTFTLRRWKITAEDQFMYMPESAFGGIAGVPGFGFPGGLAGFGALAGAPAFALPGAWNTTSLAPGFTPDQSIFTALGSRYGNTSLGQLEWDLSPKTSFTASGSYGLLRFTGISLYDTTQVNGGFGYSHTLDAANSFGLSYNFGRFSYANLGTEFENHAIYLNYARRITGRLVLHLSGGPQVSRLNGVAVPETSVSWTVQNAFQYQRNRYGLAATYSHLTTGGSGVLVGAKTDGVQLSGNRSLGRTWSLGTNLGFSRNVGLTAPVTYKTGYAGAQIHHDIGRNVAAVFQYQFQRQLNICTAGACGTVGITRHQFTFGFDWHPRPLRIG